MTAGMPELPQPTPYVWDEAQVTPPEVSQLWSDVAEGLEKSQTVVWKSAVDSLGAASRFIATSQEARAFVEKYTAQIISILVEQQPGKIGPMERQCVQDSLLIAAEVVAADLSIQIQRNGDSKVLDVLNLIFNKKKAYYKGTKGNWNSNNYSGLPEVRLKVIERFRAHKGFQSLEKYLRDRIGTADFPTLDALRIILSALGDSLISRPTAAEQAAEFKGMEDDAIGVSKAVMDNMNNCDEEALKKFPSENMMGMIHDLQRVFDRLMISRRDSTYEFYEFWRGLILKHITSKSLPLKLFGWQQVDDILEASEMHRPPPRCFEVSDAGCEFVNGAYPFAGTVTSDGYAQTDMDIKYQMKIPDDDKQHPGKKLTLFRCTMRSQQKWWFLSEADEEQPGTDRDIDYYQHKSKEHEEKEPPPAGWLTCRSAGQDPPPRLQKKGLMVPAGKEFDTLEHQLAKWAIENGIIELVLGDSVHREIVARSTSLIKFLASMCERDSPDTVVEGKAPNMYCLQTNHLLLAWKTCTKKADAAVSAQVYQLLVTILPTCPNSLAIPLIKAIQTSLSNKEKRDYLQEVAEFCSALASANMVDVKSSVHLSDDVRAEVLELLWAILMHPEASSLKTYEHLKRYVTSELKVEPEGSKHREKYLQHCIDSLSSNTKLTLSGSVDEALALKAAKLTNFVLEACPREQATELILSDSGALAGLLLNELIAYLKRRKASKSSNDGEPNGRLKGNKYCLSERLRILRYVYGLTNEIFMTLQELHTLWELCDDPEAREELMIYIADASTGSVAAPTVGPVQQTHGVQPQNIPETDQSQVFTDESCFEAFLHLFCSQHLSFEDLGEGAYRSFQFMFNKMRMRADKEVVTASALDTLWRICLRTGSDAVASQAMKDLLSLYVSSQDRNKKDTFQGEIETNDQIVPSEESNPTSPRDQMQTDSIDGSFEKRVFECLSNVRNGLINKAPGAALATQRCLLILNMAIGQHESASSSIACSTLNRLVGSISATDGLAKVVKVLPHGMRGEAAYRKVGIMVKRTGTHIQLPPTSQNDSAASDDSGANPPRSPTNLRFTMDVHPMETLFSIKSKVAAYCECSFQAVKPISVSGRQLGANNGGQSRDVSQMSLNVVPEDSVVDELGIVSGCELVFVITGGQNAQNTSTTGTQTPKAASPNGLSDIFYRSDDGFPDQLFTTLLGVLESLPPNSPTAKTDSNVPAVDSHALVWDLLLAMPTNPGISSQVLSTAGISDLGRSSADNDAMEVDARQSDKWSSIFDLENFHRSVYTLLAIDAMMQPASEVLSFLPPEHKAIIARELLTDAASFRQGFIASGGFDAVVNFFSALAGGDHGLGQNMARMGNAVALRILKCCLFPKQQRNGKSDTLDEAGNRLLGSLTNSEGLLQSLTAMVVRDIGIATSTISDVLKLLQLLLRSPDTAQEFVSLPGKLAQEFLVALLLWEGGTDTSRPNLVGAASKVRKTTHDLILGIPALADQILTWLIAAIDKIQVTSDSTSEYFDVLQKLVSDESSTAQSRSTSFKELSALGTAVCKKIASCPRPTGDTPSIDVSTGVLCGCLTLLRALIIHGGGSVLKDGKDLLVTDLGTSRWSSSQPESQSAEDAVLIDLMGVIFDAFLSPGGSSSVVAICCDKESRERGFAVVDAAAQSCQGGDGYLALVSKINGLISAAAPFLKHGWGQSGESHSRAGSRNTSKYSGLRNQGCTCYMNSFLQQMFMMPELRSSLCSAPLPASVRSSGGLISAKGAELVGKKISLQWDNGVSYDANVLRFDEKSGMHTIQYCPLQVATVSGSGHHQVQPNDISMLPPLLAEEFFLSEGRPGKETGIFEVANSLGDNPEGGPGTKSSPTEQKVEESEDEAASRHLMEEIQRTLIHLDEGSRGHCFDPRALVEACACLKLEFDVWQQNDASEFATKLLDRLEITLKRWAPDQFRYLDHTFGLKQTKQKICKECGLKTNREEKLLNVDCQIRGKADINEALSTMTEVEIMEGSNQVFCDRCKKNTDTILRTAISELPNMLILSLKRFDLDYNTFETVKLNSRCAFGQSLNLKQYTLEGLEAMEQSAAGQEGEDPSPMDTGNGLSGDTAENALSHLPDEDYEYKLAGVLVHAGVAQGGHYYSFIKDRSTGSDGSWYRFDDDDVTPFDPANIEAECFGGKVKKETKWPNGQVHTVESEQYANALMLFYEKVKPTPTPPEKEKDDQKEEKAIPRGIPMSTGYDVFEPDVKRSNATHRWQTFLFDSEFQLFLLGLLQLCSPKRNTEMASTVTTHPPVSDFHSPWKRSLIQMLLTFFFDVMLYASDKPALGGWVQLVEQVIRADVDIAHQFVFELASRTKTVSANWIRTYLSDCPDQHSRSAATRIFSTAVQACLNIESEQKELSAWSQSWKEQLVRVASEKILPFPCTLKDQWASHEQISAFGQSGVSLIGTIISHLNVLMEASTRNWKFNPELTIFTRNLASTNRARGGDLIRKAMVSAMIPVRLICLIVRERSSPDLRAAFPGASVSTDVAETQMRAESSPTSHMMSLSTNISSSDYRGGGSPMDHLPSLEAICCLLGVKGTVFAPLLVEVEDPERNRSRMILSHQAQQAFKTIFEECCGENMPGMGQREIDIYLRRCGVDSSSVSPQKIAEIMSNHPLKASDGTLIQHALSLEGFFQYYIDIAQSSDARVRLDLNSFGYRPDLSRRSFEHRVVVVNNHEQLRHPYESIALDVASSSDRSLPSRGGHYETALSSFQLYLIAYSASEPLAEHLVAAACTNERDPSVLVANTLQAVYYAPAGWAGTEHINAALMILRILASIPGEDQQECISMIMQCPDRPPQADHGVGLLVAAHAVYGARANSQHYQGEDLYDRYVSVLKYLVRIGSVTKWMQEHYSMWQWMERDLVEQRHHGSNQRVPAAGHMHDGQHSDSDMQGMDDSGDETDSRTFEEMETAYSEAPSGVEVRGAGNPLVNGFYSRDGIFEDVYKYSKTGEYNGAQCQFAVFQCNVSNNTKHWYISVVPTNGQPGTSADVDFYSAPAEYAREFPPINGWTKAIEGRDPPPELSFVRQIEDRSTDDRGFDQDQETYI